MTVMRDAMEKAGLTGERDLSSERVRGTLLRVFPVWLRRAIKADVAGGLVTWSDVQACHDKVVDEMSGVDSSRGEMIAIKLWCEFRDSRRRGN